MTTPASSTDAALAARLRLAITRLNRRLRQEAPSGVTPSMISALVTIRDVGPVTLGDLAHAERVQPPTMTRIVGALEDAELVSRSADPADRRVVLVTITPEGAELLDQSRTRKNARLAERLAAFDDRDLKALEDALPVLERLAEPEAGAQ